MNTIWTVSLIIISAALLGKALLRLLTLKKRRQRALENTTLTYIITRTLNQTGIPIIIAPNANTSFVIVQSHLKDAVLSLYKSSRGLNLCYFFWVNLYYSCFLETQTGSRVSGSEKDFASFSKTKNEKRDSAKNPKTLEKGFRFIDFLKTEVLKKRNGFESFGKINFGKKDFTKDLENKNGFKSFGKIIFAKDFKNKNGFGNFGKIILEKNPKNEKISFVENIKIKNGFKNFRKVDFGKTFFGKNSKIKNGFENLGKPNFEKIDFVENPENGKGCSAKNLKNEKGFEKVDFGKMQSIHNDSRLFDNCHCEERSSPFKISSLRGRFGVRNDVCQTTSIPIM